MRLLDWHRENACHQEVGMKRAKIIAMAAVWVAGGSIGLADEYQLQIVARGLQRPVGIAVAGSETVYFTQVPQPGVAGGANGVFALDLETRQVTTLHQGEPEPTNIALDREDNVYWTCKSAGVILRATEGQTSLVLEGLQQPSGISVGKRGEVYFTEIPMPGVPGGANAVSVFDGSRKTILHMGEPEPTDIVVSRDGTLYWTCKTAGVILRQSQGVTDVLLAGLDNPVGIALDHKGRELYFTEVPTPGIAGAAGGRNSVKRLTLETMQVSVINQGDPEPTDVAVARNGRVYWTCTVAGVIVEARLRR
jgi:streptogramin lyase